MNDLTRDTGEFHLDIFVEDLLGVGVDEADLDAGGPDVDAHDVGGQLVFGRLL